LVHVPPPDGSSTGVAGADPACPLVGFINNIIVVAAEMAINPALLIASLRVIVFLLVALMPKSSLFVFIIMRFGFKNFDYYNFDI
jgi:predicted Kef-type K+ transport protein